MTSPSTIAEDRRVFYRFPARYPARLKDVYEDFGINVYLRNVSAGGARLTVKERLFLHDLVSIEVKLPDGHTPMILGGEVRWVRSQEYNLWDVGLEFPRVRLITLARLYQLTEQHPALA